MAKMGLECPWLQLHRCRCSSLTTAPTWRSLLGHQKGRWKWTLIESVIGLIRRRERNRLKWAFSVARSGIIDDWARGFEAQRRVVSQEYGHERWTVWMNEYMSERTKNWVNEWTYEWTNKRMNTYTNEWVRIQTNGWVEGYVAGCMNEWINE